MIVLEAWVALSGLFDECRLNSTAIDLPALSLINTGTIACCDIPI